MLLRLCQQITTTTTTTITTTQYPTHDILGPSLPSLTLSTLSTNTNRLATMKGRSIERLVYEQIFPKPKPNDPQTFQTFLTRNLVVEVRMETQAFYGHLDTHEAKYPGLDYDHPTHRIRLGRYPWHRRLFRAFDTLGLTSAEIAGLTRWEGTKWAKEKFESENGVVIKDTTGDEIPHWDDLPERPVRINHASRAVRFSRSVVQPQVQQQEEDEDSSDVDAEDDSTARGAADELDEKMGEEDVPARNSNNNNNGDDEQIHSIGLELNERLRAGAARRAAGEEDAVLDEEWEQWLRNALDNGILHRDATGDPSSLIPLNMIPAPLTASARAGRWAEVPEYLRAVLRASFQQEGISLPPERTAATAASVASVTPATGLPVGRRVYSGLRLPVGGRTAQSSRAA